MEPILKIANFILDSFIHIWPYLLITIPIAVAVQVSGASKYINKAFSKKPLVSIFLATVVGAFSPFCSCGVIPIIASLLIGGVPLAPVMAFWIASPSMDPEIFFLSTATIGWKLSIWRLAATFAVSLFSGYFTHFALSKGLLAKEILRSDVSHRGTTRKWNFSEFFAGVKNSIIPVQRFSLAVEGISTKDCCSAKSTVSTCGPTAANVGGSSCSVPASKSPSLTTRLLTETRKATWLVVKFMFLAFLVNALISFYVPQDYIIRILGGEGTATVISAAFIGIPVYTSNLTALPLIGGLLTLGMNQGAALAFLISGPTTTLPAMVAVYGIVKRKIFFMYISFSLVGAILFGILFNLAGSA